MTRIIGILSWYDESPTWLGAVVASMARICDHVVAVDGRYALYDPEGRQDQSSTAEHDAIWNAARGSGVGLTLHTRPRPYRDEMEKRTHAFRLAEVEAGPEDWYFILDADELVVTAPSKDVLHQWLDDARSRGVCVLQAGMWERADPQRIAKAESGRVIDYGEAGRIVPVDHDITCPSPRLWRALPNMRVVGYHYNYVADDPETGEPVELWGDDSLCKDARAPWDSIRDQLVLENRNRLRTIVRDKRRQRYYADRDETGIERRLPLAELMEEA